MEVNIRKFKKGWIEEVYLNPLDSTLPKVVYSVYTTDGRKIKEFKEVFGKREVTIENNVIIDVKAIPLFNDPNQTVIYRKRFDLFTGKEIIDRTTEK